VFQAFGSYPGRQEIDFTDLAARGLFVVSGPTGTGKTTIFDAIVFALYGVLPGQRSVEGECRSHHAPAHVETFVELTFEVDGVRHVVRRTPRQPRPRQRGEGTVEQPATATLVRLRPGGATESLATKPTDARKACQELVGLDARQFQRVVLLPQGQFTDFLLASDEEREKLLRQLFGGELYQHAVDWLKDRVAALRAEVGEVDELIRHHLRNAVADLGLVGSAWRPDLVVEPLDERTPEQLGELAAALVEEAVLRRTEVNALQREADHARTTLAESEALAERLRLLAAARATRQTLEDERPSVDTARTRLADARRAAPVVAAADLARSAIAAAEAAEASLLQVRTRIATALRALGRPLPDLDAAAVAAALAELRHEVDAQQQVLQEAASADRAATEAEAESAAAETALAEAQADLLAKQELLARLTAEAAALAATAAGVGDLARAEDDARRCHADRTALDEALARADAAEARAVEAQAEYESLMAAFVAGQAARLATTLQDGVPCPVCGSAEHPAPARHTEVAAVDHDAVDAGRMRWSAATTEAADRRAAVGPILERLGGLAHAPLPVLEEALHTAEARHAEARTAAAEHARLEERIAKGEQLVAESGPAVSDAAEAAVRCRTLATAARAEAVTRTALAAAIDPGSVVAAQASLAGLAEDAVLLAPAADALTTALARAAQAADALTGALAAAELPDEPAARALALPPEQETALAETVRSWDRSVDEVNGRIAALTAQGFPSDPPDPEACRVAAETAGARAAAAREAFTTADDALARAQEDLGHAAKAAEGSADLRAAFDVARTVHETCAGARNRNPRLDRWVLAGELDRVTEAANVHLARMTANRYQLRRRDDEDGGGRSTLTLEVLDAHTGRGRSTGSLSGGEQFQASLSLALGLADVVSQGGSGTANGTANGTAKGKIFEALFVDEGFGSLDPQSLDEAINALASLQAGGRMVGAITHVEAMKQQLHVGIEVRARADGRGSELVVHP
jgi:exonuclease SbcC